MANVDQPIGARYHSGPDRLRHYDVDASNTTAIFIGDFVAMEDDGNITPAAAGGVILGVSNGYIAATTAGLVPVFDDPQTLFIIQADDDGTALAEADTGTNAEILAGTGNSDTLRSAHELDQSSKVAATAQLRIIDKMDTPSNAWGAHVDLIVKINEHLYGTATNAGI